MRRKHNSILASRLKKDITGKNNRDDDPDYLSSCSDTNELDEANDIGKEHHALKK